MTRTILITGTSSGFGRETAERLARDGYRVFAAMRDIASRNRSHADALMAEVVVNSTSKMSDADVRAMAVYLASFNETAIDSQAQAALARKLEASTRVTVASSTGARLYLGACAVCHEVGGPPLFGSRPSLALNSNLHAAVPDNLVQVILHGIAAPVSSDLGYMPAFKDSLSDGQLAELVSYLRRQFAPEKPAWTGVGEAINRIRQGMAR